MRHLALLAALVFLAGCEGPATTATRDEGRLDRIAVTYEQGDTAAAISLLTEYLDAYPRDDLAWTILGHAYEESDRLDEAQTAYERALEVNPRQAQAIIGQGILHRRRGEYDQAMAAYESAVEIDPDCADAYSSMAVIALKRNQDDQALKYAKRAYDLDKSTPRIAANLAVAYHYVGDMENRDRFTRIAEQLGYDKVDTLEQIYSGELTVRD